MAFSTSPIEVGNMVRDKVIDPRDKKTVPKDNNYYQWWLAQDDKTLVSQLLSTTNFLKNVHSSRIRQASLYSRLYSGKPLYNYLASTSSMDNSNQFPMGRPTANVVYSCIDTLTSMIAGQEQPTPTFITDGSHYKQRRMALEMDQFIRGEFYRAKAYPKGTEAFADAGKFGNGFVKLVKKDGRVDLQRTLETELLVDFNDGYYRDPRSLIHHKLCDRGVYADMFPKAEAKIFAAHGGTVDNSPQSTDTVSDQFIIAEGWHLPSGKDTDDGRHAIVCSEGIILDEDWAWDYFPFEKLDYNQQSVGWFSQGLAEILFPTQMEIYKMLIIASQAIEMVGVPRWIISELSKIAETSLNNNIASIVKVKTMTEAPQLVTVAPNNPQIYQYIDWLIKNAYQMSGISELNAAAKKPAGLNSGAAQREYQDTQTMRFAALDQRYQNFYPSLAYKMIDMAKDIEEETGKPYTTLSAGEQGVREIALPDIKQLKDAFIIKCMPESGLPQTPAGRQAKLSEMLAANEITTQEFRRMSRLPDLEQSDQLAVALEERILHDLDQIVEKGEKGYTAPDEFMLDPTNLILTLTTQTINKYAVSDLEEEKMDLLRKYFSDALLLVQSANPPTPQPQAAPPQGVPAGLPVAPPAPSIAPTSGAQV